MCRAPSNVHMHINRARFMNHTCRHNKYVPAKNKCIIKQANHKTIPFTYRNTLEQNQNTLACTTYSHAASDKKELLIQNTAKQMDVPCLHTAKVKSQKIPKLLHLGSKRSGATKVFSAGLPTFKFISNSALYILT